MGYCGAGTQLFGYKFSHGVWHIWKITFSTNWLHFILFFVGVLVTMSSLGFSYGHLYVQQKRQMEKQKNMDNQKSKANNENSNGKKKIHPAAVIAATEECQPKVQNSTTKWNMSLVPILLELFKNVIKYILTTLKIVVHF